MTTGRINQVTILKPPPRAETQAEAGSKVYQNMISHQRNPHTGWLAARTRFRDLQSTRHALAKYRSLERSVVSEWASSMQTCFVRGRSPPVEVGFANWRLAALFTHNHTIICGSLEEGLRYSPHVHHAGARCHKNFMSGWGANCRQIRW